MVAAVQLAPDHEPRPQAGADGQEGEVIDPASDAAPAFTDRREVDVVFDRDADTEPLLELAADLEPFEPGYVLGEPDVAGARIDGARHTDGRCVDRLRR